MTTARRKHFAVEQLSEEGQAVVRRGLEGNWTLEKIVEALKTITGETIALSSVHRWSRWQKMQQRFTEYQQARDLATELISSVPDPRFIAALNNALKHHLMGKEEELQQESALELMKHLLKLEQVELAHGKLRVNEQIADAESLKAQAAMTMASAALERVRLAKEKAQKVGETLERAEGAAAKGRALTAEELREIRQSVFGLVDDLEEANAG